MSLGTVVVATDFSPESERAIGHAAAIARRAGARLLVCHVETSIEPLEAGLVPDGASLPAFRQFLDEEVAESRRLLAALVARHAAPDLELEPIVAQGFPDSALVDLATARGAGLIVVGTHGRSGVRRVLLGSVAEKVVRTFERAVMVARGEPPTAAGYRRILVPTDFSPRAEHALRAALGLAAEGAEVVLLHAWQLAFGHYLPGEASEAMLAPVRASVEAGARQQAAAVLAAHAGAPVELRLEVVEGAPGRAIEERAADRDLVVIGSHGRRGVRRWLLGSLSEATVRAAPCTVVVVHGEGAAADGDAAA